MTEVADGTAAAAALIETGSAAAREIGNPIMRARHHAAWAFRQSRVDPKSAAGLLDGFPEEPLLRARFLAGLASDLCAAGETDLLPHFERAIAEAGNLEAESRLRILNTLCETAIAHGERDAVAAVGLLRLLTPEVSQLRVPPGHPDQPRALGLALVGEALAALDAPEGRGLLDQAADLARDLPGGDAILGFVAGVLLEHQPGEAPDLAAGLQDAASRLELRLQLAEKASDPELRDRLLDAAREDAAFVEPMRVPEALVMLGQALAPHDPDASRAVFRQALEAGDPAQAQLKSLQWTGVASAIAGVDREWAEEVFAEAVATASADEDRGRRATALALIAGEMAASHPRDAAALLERAVGEALELQAVWEYAHLLEVLFRPDRSPYLDLTAAAALIERVLELLSDEDPRIPGVFGLPEAGRLMLQVDEERAAGILRRWFDLSEQAGDTDGMTSAAVGLLRADDEQGREALTRTHDLLLRRIDCPAMGEFSRQAAPFAPELVVDLAAQIPDRRERADALALAALNLYGSDPQRSLALIDSLERPTDRSSALLTLADRLLQVNDLPYPQTLLEDLP